MNAIVRKFDLELTAPVPGPWQIIAMIIALAKTLLSMAYLGWVPSLSPIPTWMDLILLPVAFGLAQRFYVQARVHIPTKKLIAVIGMVVGAIFGAPFGILFVGIVWLSVC